MVELFAALGEPNRYRIVELLRAGPLPVNDIGERLRLRQPQVSKHLKVLKAAGLVDARPRGAQRVYQLRAKPMRRLHQWLERYRALWDTRAARLDAALERAQRDEKARGRRKRG